MKFQAIYFQNYQKQYLMFTYKIYIKNQFCKESHSNSSFLILKDLFTLTV